MAFLLEKYATTFAMASDPQRPDMMEGEPDSDKDDDEEEEEEGGNGNKESDPDKKKDDQKIDREKQPVPQRG